MGTSFTIGIPYQQLLLLVMALFMFVGATRGVVRESITSFGLVVLTAILIKPQLAAPLIDYLSKFLRLMLAFIMGKGNLEPSKLMSRYASIQLPFDGKNPYLLLVWALVGFVILSYSTRSNNKNVTGLGHILGGLLGLCNGYLSVWLVMQYVVKYFQKTAPELTAAGAPQQVAVAIQGLPSQSTFPGEGQSTVLILLFLMTVFVLLGRVSAKPAKKG